jgi:hypothetical protein
MWSSGSVLALRLTLAAASVLHAQENTRPCEAETAPLMTLKSSWSEMHLAALSLPSRCFDGYFAEGISEMVTRKMRTDWPGFLALLARLPQEDAFFSLVLRSINATLEINDIKSLDTLARKSCPDEHKARCGAIARQAAAALAEAK